MVKRSHKPIYRQFIEDLKRGFSSLDDSIQDEIKKFITSRQHKSGGFTGRSGKPDFYYSLFGIWLSMVTDLEHVIENCKKYINTQNKPGETIDKMAYMMINISLSGQQKQISVFSILRKIYKDRKRIDLSYRFFLLMLILDARNKHQAIFRFIARIWLMFYKINDNIPCSILAALAFVKKRVGMEFEKEQKKLLSCFADGKGFASFENGSNSDLLSIAVALFVLKDINYDIRQIAPDCLKFVEQNYDSGAFLSGDGDKTQDLEYTFYGLLALGSLVK